MEFAATTSIGSNFQMCGAATAKARLPTVDSLTGGTTRRLAFVEPNGVFVDQASRRHGSADLNLEHRHVEFCTPTKTFLSTLYILITVFRGDRVYRI